MTHSKQMQVKDMEELENRLRALPQLMATLLPACTVDERMVARVHVAIEALPQHRPVTKAVYVFAIAACLLVMVISGAMLLLPRLGGIQGENGLIMLSAEPAPAQTLKAQSLAADVSTTSYSQDGTALPYGIASVAEFNEGYAVAKATNGLYGYVDEEKRWVIHAIYDEALPVHDGYAFVTLSGQTSQILMPVT